MASDLALKDKETNTNIGGSIDISVQKEIAKISNHKNSFLEVKDNYMSLEIKDFSDIQGFEKVRAARIHIKRELSALDTERLDIKRAVVNLIDGTARSIKEQGEIIKNHLEKKENWFIDEKNRIKEEKAAEAKRKEEEIQQKIITRITSLEKYGWSLDYADASLMSDEDFKARLDEAAQDFELKKKEQEDRERKEKQRIEAERIEAEKAAAVAAKEMEAAKEKMALEAKKIAEEKEILRIQNEKAYDERLKLNAEKAAHDEKVRKAEAARKELLIKEREAEAFKKAQAQEAKTRADAEARQELLRPDKERLSQWLKSIDLDIENTEGLQKESIEFIKTVRSYFESIIENNLKNLAKL